MVAAEVELTDGARRILDAASELFYRSGIHAVGVDAIAAESGVTKRTLYNRFGSKDALVVAYLEERHRQWWARFEERLGTAEHPRALALFDSYLGDVDDGDRGCAFINAAGELPFSHPGYGVIRDHKARVYERLIELVAEDELVDDPQAVAEHVYLLLEGAAAHRGIDGSDQRLVRARELARQFLARARRPAEC
ncbi:TetR family transcriptional regulator [Rhodococcus sp. OK519]|uniref:TetR/AcrR family transcriptional regulator n=1 Tax=Rhodococcus sp. OK519 TaxID=2135729 RepID=UPI000D339773|nr:TetR family transcriptional regulator [Rhodococcus sp. OK519]